MLKIGTWMIKYYFIKGICFGLPKNTPHMTNLESLEFLATLDKG